MNQVHAEIGRELRANGSIAGRPLRGLKADLDRNPTSADMGLRSWQTVRCDREHDRYIVETVARAWLRRVVELCHPHVMWWTKDLPARLRALRGPPGVVETRFEPRHGCRRLLRRHKTAAGTVLVFRSDMGGEMWPRMRVRFTDAGYEHRRLTLREWLWWRLSR
jgi:hypothetical protein